jgi:hypothetical protein
MIPELLTNPRSGCIIVLQTREELKSMIIIQHTYTTHTEVIFDQDFRMPLVGTMDDIAESVCDEMVKHKFHHADVCDAETGEILMIIDRSL